MLSMYWQTWNWTYILQYTFKTLAELLSAAEKLNINLHKYICNYKKIIIE